MERKQHAGETGQHRRQHVGDLLVVPRRVADELRPLLVLANRHQHGADRRAMKTPERDHNDQTDNCDERVIDPAILQIESEPARTRYAAESVLTAGERRPPERDCVGQRREGQRQQREIDTAAAQYQKRDRYRGNGQECQREECRPQHRSREPMSLCERGGVCADAEPRAVSERDEARIPDQNVECHAGNRKNDDVRGTRQRETARQQRKRKHGEPCRSDHDRR